MLKMQTKGSIFAIIDGERTIEFEKLWDVWAFVFMLRGIRPKVDMGPRSLYPVKSLNPVPERKGKTIKFHFSEAMSYVASRASGACPTTLCDTKVDGEKKENHYKEIT